MPNTTQIVKTDVAGKDSVAFVYYSPKFKNGLKDSVATNNKQLKQYIDYPIKEELTGMNPSSYMPTPLHTSGTLILLVVSFLLICFCYRIGYKYIKTFIPNMWSNKRTENHFDDHTSREKFISAALLLQTFIAEGIATYCGLTIYLPEFITTNITISILGLVLCWMLYHFIQLGVIRFLGYVFCSQKETNICIKGHNATVSLIGLIIAPFSTLMLFLPTQDNAFLCIIISLYILGRLVFNIKCFRIFYKNLFQYLYFILYLCSIEVVLPIFLIRGVLSICN